MRRALSPSILCVILATSATAVAQQTPTPTLPPPAPPAASAPTAPPPPPPCAGPGAGASLVPLRVLRDKGLMTEVEYESAVHDIAESVGDEAGKQKTFVAGQWATTLYGFVEADSIWDSTRSFNDLAGSAPVARGGTISGDNGRFTLAARNSRIGFRMKAPELDGGIRTSAMLEMDFLGTQLPVGYGAGTGSEGAYFTNPTFRIRHMNLKVETPIVDVLFGQYWQLFGWQSAFQPNTVEIQGVPGEVYSRAPQLRLSKTIKLSPVTIELAVAATRPVQRDAATPDGQAGLRLALDSWTGVQTVGATGTQIAPLSVAVTGYARRVMVNNVAAAPTFTNDKSAGGVAFDAFVPVLPGTEDDKGNSLSLNGEYASGNGDGDFYAGLNGGIGSLTGGPGVPAAPTGYTPNIDSGIVAYDAGHTLHFIQWSSYLIGAQYYLPGLDGRLWVSGNYSHLTSSNSNLYGAAKSTITGEDWFDVNVMGSPLPALRAGLEYASFRDSYADGQHALNQRVQLSGFFVF